MTIEARDPYTAGHRERLTQYGVAVGRAIGLDEPMLKALRLGGFLHHEGKIALPDRILLKRAPLDPAERATIQADPVVGAELLQGLRTLNALIPIIIRHHHERCNGSGYPGGLGGEAIPPGAQIMAVVDLYDALRTERPYPAALPHQEAVAILRREAEAGGWDPRIITAFFEWLSDQGQEATQ